MILAIYAYCLSYGYARIRGGSLKSKTTESKDKDGKVTKTTNYHYEFPGTAEVSYSVYDPNGEVLDSGSANMNNTLSSSASTSSSNLRKQYKSIRDKLSKSYAYSVTKSAIANAKTGTAKFDFRNTNKNAELFFVRKHADEDKFKMYVEQAQEVYKNSEATTPAVELKGQLSEMISFWEGHASKDPKGEKQQTKIYTAANYNLGLVSLFLDDLDKAEKHAEMTLAANGGKHPKSKRYRNTESY